MLPADGERRFNSAMTATVGRRSADRNEVGIDGARSRSRSRAALLPCKAGRLWRVVLRIWSRRPAILSFGGYSGTFFRALFGRSSAAITLGRNPDAADQAPE